MRLAASGFPRMSLLRLSEKGSERGFDRRFGQYTNAKTARKVPFRCPVRLRWRSVRDFSDSFSETVRKGVRGASEASILVAPSNEIELLGPVSSVFEVSIQSLARFSDSL